MTLREKRDEGVTRITIFLPVSLKKKVYALVRAEGRCLTSYFRILIEEDLKRAAAATGRGVTRRSLRAQDESVAL